MARLLTTTPQIRALLGKLTGAVAQNITSSTNASPTVLTLASHGLLTGDALAVANHTTNTNANGARLAVVIDANTFSMTDLNGTAINGNGVGGATGTIQRLTVGWIPHDLKNVLYKLSRRSWKRGNDITALTVESTVQTILGL